MGVVVVEGCLPLEVHWQRWRKRWDVTDIDQRHNELEDSIQ